MELASSAHAMEWLEWRWRALDQPCLGDCAIVVYAGRQVQTDLEDIIFKPVAPWSWEMGNSGIVATAISRRLATLFGVIDLEPELGVAKRFGNTSEAELWGALYFRFTAFPWNDIVFTTVALSTGVNYATGISDWERAISRPSSKGSQVLHYFSPEITFASPAYRSLELVFRMHHRSGVYGLFSEASGSQYITAGFRWRF
jgi:hypothetical protein